MEKFLTPERIAKIDAMRQRSAAISALAAALVSDPQWQPECDACLVDPWANESGIAQVVLEGERVRTSCPAYAPTCRLGLWQEQRRIAEERHNLEARLRESGVGRRYWDVTRFRLRNGEEVISYLDELRARVEQGKGLLLTGPVGVGKTAALALIAKEARCSCEYITVGRLMGALMRFRGEQRDWGTPWVNTRLLLLDELGAAYENDFAMAQFEELIGMRYDNRLATCIATNLTVSQLREMAQYRRMVDRWRETNVVMEMVGKSQREAQQ